MRSAFSALILALALSTAIPSNAQLRGGEDLRRSPVRVLDNGASTFTLNKLFSPEHFRMAHSYEFSTSSFGGFGSSMGMYTNTMMWQFNQKLAARVDVSYAHQPFGGGQFGTDGHGGQLFLRNAELAYRPKENLELHFSIRQSPYGSYMGPFGYYSPFGPYHGMRAHRADNLFWRDSHQ